MGHLKLFIEVNTQLNETEARYELIQKPPPSFALTFYNSDLHKFGVTHISLRVHNIGQMPDSSLTQDLPLLPIL